MPDHVMLINPLDDRFANAAIIGDVAGRDAGPQHPNAPPKPAHNASTEDAVAHALRATIRAEELQRADPVDRMEGLSERQRAFLKKNRVLMRDDIAPIAGQHYQQGLAQGLANDSPEIEHFILEKTTQSLEQRRKLRGAAEIIDNTPPEYDPETRRQAMLLEHEAELLAEPPEREAPPPIASRRTTCPAWPRRSPARSRTCRPAGCTRRG
jgi:hypothetical protein